VKRRAVEKVPSNNKQRWNHKEPIPAGKSNPRAPGLRLTVGVMGSASGSIAAHALALARELGRAIAAAGCITITGACPGLPLAAAQGAYGSGGLVVGISPGLSLDEHRDKFNSPIESHDVLIFTGSGLMGREVVNIRSSDMVAILGGRSGTLGELAIAYDEGKLIGVLTDTGGISNMVSNILQACKKNTGARVLYDDDPHRLVERMVKTYRLQHYKKPSIFESQRQNT
jgi:uncharacterized protein (TIGR00725 family)